MESDLEMNSNRALTNKPPSFESSTNASKKRKNQLEGGEGSGESKASNGEILRQKHLKKFKEDNNSKVATRAPVIKETAVDLNRLRSKESLVNHEVKVEQNSSGAKSSTD